MTSNEPTEQRPVDPAQRRREQTAAARRARSQRAAARRTARMIEALESQGYTVVAPNLHSDV